MMRKPLFRPEMQGLLEKACLGAIFIFYALLKSSTIRFTSGDEGLFFYQALLWVEGLTPHRDFFVSRPPLALITAALPIALFGINFPLLHWIARAAGGISGLIIYRIVKRELGYLPGLLACFLFLFSHTQLAQGDHFSGINLSIMLLLLAIDFFLQRKYVLAGAFVAVASSAGVHAVIALLPLGIIALLEDQKHHSHHPWFRIWRTLHRDTAKRFPRCTELTAGFVFVFAMINAAFSVIGGLEYWKQVYFFHSTKVSAHVYYSDPIITFKQFLHSNLLIALLVVFTLHIVLIQLYNDKKQDEMGESTKTFLFLSLLLLMVEFLFLSRLRLVFSHYMLLVLPFGVMVATYGVAAVTSYCSRIHWIALKKAAQFFWLTLVLLFITKFALYSIPPYTIKAFQNVFHGAYDIAIYLQEHTEEDETIYGDFGIVPTIALLSDRRIAGEEAESAVMRFDTNIRKMLNIIEKIEQDNLTVIISREDAAVLSFKPFKRYVEKNYTIEKTFVGADPRPIHLWRKKPEVAGDSST